ncbi:MAG: hypothetical protein HYX44_16485, partial [Aquabacterium sp.]|nr:hypothetical protein [Aquabacterium sp.]
NGRQPESFGVEGWTNVRTGAPDDWRATIEQWRGLGATHITLRVAGLESPAPDRHIDAMRRYREAIPAEALTS